MMDRQSLKVWMVNNLGNHIDPLTGEVCMTTLAEDCSDTNFNRAATDREFELAFEVAEEGRSHNAG